MKRIIVGVGLLVTLTIAMLFSEVSALPAVKADSDAQLTIYSTQRGQFLLKPIGEFLLPANWALENFTTSSQNLIVAIPVPGGYLRLKATQVAIGGPTSCSNYAVFEPCPPDVMMHVVDGTLRYKTAYPVGAVLAPYSDVRLVVYRFPFGSTTPSSTCASPETPFQTCVAAANAP